MDNFKTIYRILHYLEKAMDYEVPSMKPIAPEHLRITRQRWSVIMALLLEEGLVNGLAVKRFTGGTVSVCGEHPWITLRGLEYLEMLGGIENVFNKR